jgi:hypothetical protein
MKTGIREYPKLDSTVKVAYIGRNLFKSGRCLNKKRFTDPFSPLHHPCKPKNLHFIDELFSQIARFSANSFWMSAE